LINGATLIIAIIGSPIAQVKSPENFNAHFARSGDNVVMIPVGLGRDGLDSFVATVRNWKNLEGFVVTIPYKHEIACGLDSVTERGAMLGAVNVVRREIDGTLRGDMVDGLGCLAAARSHGFDPAGKHAFVAGAGGAGSAIAYGLCEAGAAQLYLADIDTVRLDRLASLLSGRFLGTTVKVETPEMGSLDFVVNATPLGMKRTDPLPLGADLVARLAPTALVADVVTSPAVTPFLETARARGCAVQEGPEMARGQMELLGRFLGVMGAE
jgi:shikimate dehydrogenase